MLCYCNSISITIPITTDAIIKNNIKKRKRNFGLIKQSLSNYCVTNNPSTVHYDSLRILEWDKLCDSVASFAGTRLGREATKAQLWSLSQTFQHSLNLLDETNAAVQMHNHGTFALDFTRIDLLLVKSGIQQARRGLPLEGNEAMAVAVLLNFVESLQLNLKSTIKEDEDWYTRFMPLTQLIMQLAVSRSLLKLIHQVIDEDGSVKDSASSVLKRSRDQVRMLERKLYQLMDSLIRNKVNEASFLEMSNIDGRWCIKSRADQLMSFKGLLLSSGSGMGSVVEPLSAVPLNDELQQARALMAKAEADVLLMLTEKMQMNLDDIEKILNSVVQLDVINARATYSLSFGGTCPYIFLPEDKDGSLTAEAYLSGNKTSRASYHKREWILYLPKAYHPLLLQQHRQNLLKARKDVSNATAEIRRRKLQGEKMTPKGGTDINLPSLEIEVTALEQAHPVPVDFFIAQKTRVLVITGPNTGGKTICLKTVGLAAMMAKSGLYVLSSESVQIPWFDSVFADIGDEQSLSQSLSTFSGHLKQISDIQSQSTSQSLVLLDEVGAGTNPLEGAALGMSLLESFAESGALLTIATTHHGELKTLKYRDVHEIINVALQLITSVPFGYQEDREKVGKSGIFNRYFSPKQLSYSNFRFPLIFSVPKEGYGMSYVDVIYAYLKFPKYDDYCLQGRSNAINISERLGLPSTIVDNARELYGAASAEINEVIIDMERFKQNFQELLHDARHYLMLSKDLHDNLLLTRRKVMEHGTEQRYKKMREISEAAAFALSILHKKVRQLRASATQPSQPTRADKSQHKLASNHQHTTADNSRILSSVEVIRQLPSVKRSKLPKTGDMVHVSSLGKKATVLKVELSKEEIVVQVGNMKLKLKLNDVEF